MGDVIEVADHEQAAGPRVDDVVDSLSQSATGRNYVECSEEPGILAF
jgi:hypothetical protein